MPLPRPTPEALIELIGKRIRLIGQPLRIKLLDYLQHGPATVQDLTDAIGAVQQNTSQHLALLHQAGVLARRREGTRVYYELVDPHVLPLIDAATASLARQSRELARLIEPDL